MSINSFELGWISGLFEGEGHIGVVKRKGKNTYRINFNICSSDRELLEKVVRVLETGRIYTDNRENHLGKKPMYRWQIGGIEECQRVIRILYPHLSQRRQEQADKALALPVNPRGRPKSK